MYSEGCCFSETQRETSRAGDPEGNTQVTWGEPGPTETRKEELEPKRRVRSLPPCLTLQLRWISLTCFRAEHASGPGTRGAGGGDQGWEEPHSLPWPGG